MPLYWFLLVITALASDAIPARDVSAVRAVIASLGLLVGWAMLAHLAARSACRQVIRGDVGYSSAASAFGMQMDMMRWLGLAISLLILVGFGVAGLLERIPLVRDSIALRAVLLLSPAMLATVWSWCCELRFDAAVHPGAASAGNWRQLTGMFRMQAAWLLVPVMLLMLAVDLSQLLLGVTPARGAMVSGGLALLLLPFLLPTILAGIWKLAPLPLPGMHQWCEQIVAAAGVRGLRVLRWETGGSFCTAMVAGFVPGFRRLLLSDALLLRLTPRQVAMVMLHEVAHVRRFHLPLRLLVLLPVWGAATAVSWSLGDFAYAELTGVAAGLALSLVTLRAVAYRTELDADAVAVRLAPRVAAVVPGVPARPHEAAEELAEALLAVTADHPDARKATWLHPSIDQRVATLRRTVTARRSVSAGAPGAVLPATMPMASEELASRSSLDP